MNAPHTILGLLLHVTWANRLYRLHDNEQSRQISGCWLLTLAADNAAQQLTLITRNVAIDNLYGRPRLWNCSRETVQLGSIACPCI